MRKILQNLDKPLLISTFILFIIGILMVFSASNVAAYMRYGTSTYHFFIKQILAFIGGLIGAFIILRIKSKYYGYLAWLGIIGIIGLLLVLLIYGTATNNAISWINLGFIKLQPSEFAKVIIIVWLAAYYENNKNNLENYGKALFPMILSASIAFLIILQPDYGTTFIFSCLVFVIFLLSPVSKTLKRWILTLSLLLSIISLVVIFTSGKNLFNEEQIKRMTQYFNPCSEEKFYDIGNQVCNGYIAINNGGLFGLGLGNSTQKYLYLPEAHTDFIFAIIIEELGLITGIIIILLFIFVLTRIITIGQRSYTIRGALICYGIAFYIFFHIMINLGGLLGLIPLTGVPLPFLSYGGSFFLCLIVSLAFVQRINAETKLSDKKLGETLIKK